MTQNCISEIGIEDYIHRLRGPDKRLPLSGTVELTHRCNNRCVHCYVNRHQDDADAKREELTLAEITGLLVELVVLGCLWLLFTGGEPLIRDDFSGIYEYAKKKGILVSLFTNGTQVTPQLADFLQDLPPRSIEITLYGASETTYEKMTGSKGSYEACLHGIHLLLDRRLPVRLKTVITTVNIHEFHLIQDFVEALGLQFRFDALINPRIDKRGDLSGLRISPEEVVELDLTVPERPSEYLQLHKRALDIEGCRGDLFRCGAGRSTFHVDPYGRLSVCTMMRYPSYDLRKGSFQRGWYDFLPGVRNQQYTTASKCRECSLAAICHQCPAWGYLEHGDPEVPVEFLCQVTQLRAEAFGISLDSGNEAVPIQA